MCCLIKHVEKNKVLTSRICAFRFAFVVVERGFLLDNPVVLDIPFRIHLEVFCLLSHPKHTTHNKTKTKYTKYTQNQKNKNKTKPATLLFCPL